MSQTSSQFSNLIEGAGAELAHPNLLNFDQVAQREPVHPPLPLQEKYQKPVARQTKSARRFQLTLNQADKRFDLKQYLEGLRTLEKGIATLETAPLTGHKHCHFFIKFKGAIRLSYSKLCGAHVELCRGSDLANWKYITKEDQPEKAGEIFWKKGERPAEEAEEDKKKSVSIAQAYEMTSDELEELPLVYYKQVVDIQQTKQNEMTGRSANKEVKVLYFYGPSGVGKSVWAKWLFRNEPMDLVKYISTFWHGISKKASCAIYDDFRDSHMPPSEFINFIDKTRHSLNLKNGSWKNDYSHIIITSIQHPNDLYPSFQEKAIANHEEPRKQWMRRMTVVNVEAEMTPEKLHQMLIDLGVIKEQEEEEDPNDPFAGFSFK